jgi:hypothetical protein
MNWDAISAISELAAAAGVIASLVYLGKQVRQSNKLAQAQTFQERSNASRELMRWSLEPHMFLILSKYWSKPGSLNPDEMPESDRVLLTQYSRALFQHYENLHYQYEIGQIETATFKARFEPEIAELDEGWEKLGIFRGRPDFEKYRESLRRGGAA